VLPDWLNYIEIRGLCVPGGKMDFSAVRGHTSCAVEILSKPDALRVVVRK
jgi:hypothetical protein